MKRKLLLLEGEEDSIIVIMIMIIIIGSREFPTQVVVVLLSPTKECATGLFFCKGDERMPRKTLTEEANRKKEKDLLVLYARYYYCRSSRYDNIMAIIIS
jgi:hypothetical protein